ncbi:MULTISPECIES: class I adenylate-forming enzyme family protein [unclassified Rhodococcus (in: high G+C Gram-positive bacteria)]|uniref:class I adenylate-forming enzyme family protein n=1 Tax=unclassified Rhodococcus (in: high G+C Gram-positive bacteria) TaxID=192944 RepID=UPI00148350F8|nr:MULTISPECIES: class I adenylate-forming enzyme family protein [unclassified Rhodococcus (in: high G+C Gram-positive bacteria)]
MTTLETRPADRERDPLVMSFWERDTSSDLVDHTVGGVLAERAVTHSAVTALIGTRHGDGAELRLTYAELYEEALKVATALRQLAEPGEFVALWAPNNVEWPIIQFGAALAGVVLVALNPVLRRGELDYALGHSGARVLIHADSSRDYDMAEVASSIAGDRSDLIVISLSERARWRADEVAADTLSNVPHDPLAPVMLQYTSGTTGKPKGVLLCHRSLVNVAKLTMEYVGIESGSVAVNPLPMFHTAACVVATLGPVWVGGTVVLIEQFAPAPVIETARRESADLLFYVPAVLGAILESVRGEEGNAPHVTTMFGGAAPVPSAMIESAERVFGSAVLNVFGQTELSPVLSATRRTDSRRDQLTTVGHPLAQVDCKVIDPVTGDVLPIGEVGEICARGYLQFLEYWKDPDATARALDRDGFVRTGDLGSMDSRGYLTLAGRLKDLIIRGGENISPLEIESALLAVDSVLDATVIGLADARLGEVVAVVVRVRGEAAADLREQLERHARAVLSPYKVPSRWFLAEELPLTPTGKIRKFRVVEGIRNDEFHELL